MIMAQNRTTDDRQIRIGAQHIMGKLFYKVKQLHKGIVLDFHRRVLAVKHDAVLIIIHIGRILKSPSAAVDRQRNDPVILTCRMIDTTCITLVFHTKQTFRITALLCQPCRRNRFGVFFRLGQIDRNIQIAVFRWRYPLFIPANTVSSNIVRVLTEFIKEIRRCFRGLFIFLMKPADDLAGTPYQTAHDLCVKQIPINDTILLQDPVFHRIIHHFRQKIRQPFDRLFFCLFYLFPESIGIIFYPEQLQQPVCRINFILCRHQTCQKSILHQFTDFILNHCPDCLPFL